MATWKISSRARHAGRFPALKTMRSVFVRRIRENVVHVYYSGRYQHPRVLARPMKYGGGIAERILLILCTYPLFGELRHQHFQRHEPYCDRFEVKAYCHHHRPVNLDRLCQCWSTFMCKFQCEKHNRQRYKAPLSRSVSQNLDDPPRRDFTTCYQKPARLTSPRILEPSRSRT